MSFATPLFLWYFLPVVLAAVLVAPRSWRNGVVAVASMVFYVAGGGATILILLVTMTVNFLVGWTLEPDQWDLNHKRRRTVLIRRVRALAKTWSLQSAAGVRRCSQFYCDQTLESVTSSVLPSASPNTPSCARLRLCAGRRSTRDGSTAMRVYCLLLRPIRRRSTPMP